MARNKESDLFALQLSIASVVAEIWNPVSGATDCAGASQTPVQTRLPVRTCRRLSLPSAAGHLAQQHGQRTSVRS